MNYSRFHGDRPVAGAMTIPQFCAWASIGKTKLYSELKSGRLVARKLGGKTLILMSDAEEWLRSLPVVSAS